MKFLIILSLFLSFTSVLAESDLYRPISMKLYESSSGKFITFIIDIDKKITDVKSKNEYIGFSYDRYQHQVNIFIDSDRVSSTLTNTLTKTKYIDNNNQVNQAVSNHLEFNIEKNILYLDFKKGRKLANEY